jgi:DNA-binding transcriptional regulator PaaX
MSKPFTDFTRDLLEEIGLKEPILLHNIYNAHTQEKSKKYIYNTLYRLVTDGYIEEEQKAYSLTDLGRQLIHKLKPKKDGVWKIIIFDIPESKRSIRNILRSKLASLGFKKWQNSIWISPFALDPTIEQELNELGKKMFIRLIRTTEINYTEDLETLFE